MVQTSKEEIEFREYIHTKFKDHFKPFLRLHHFSELSLSRYKGFTKDHYDASLVLIFPRAYKSYDSIRRLCEVALCEDAAVILRCLLNLLVVTRWISLDPKVRAEKYLRWYWIEMYREAEGARGLVPASHLKEIQTKYAAYKSLFEHTDPKGQVKVMKQWYMPQANTILDMFKEVNMEDQYNEGYRPLSGVEHSDAMAYFAMVGASETSPDRRVLAIQSDMFIPAYLRNAFQYFGDIFKLCAKTIPLCDAKELDQIVTEGMNFYSADMKAHGQLNP
jgi:Family of unknown function (DUF5677)